MQELKYDSRDVAKKFNLQHQMILKKIDRLKRDIKATDHESRFEFETEHYEYKGREYKYTILNQTAFFMIAMSCPGVKAFKWKTFYVFANEK